MRGRPDHWTKSGRGKRRRREDDEKASAPGCETAVRVLRTESGTTKHAARGVAKAQDVLGHEAHGTAEHRAQSSAGCSRQCRVQRTADSGRRTADSTNSCDSCEKGADRPTRGNSAPKRARSNVSISSFDRLRRVCDSGRHSKPRRGGLPRGASERPPSRDQTVATSTTKEGGRGERKKECSLRKPSRCVFCDILHISGKQGRSAACKEDGAQMEQKRNEGRRHLHRIHRSASVSMFRGSSAAAAGGGAAQPKPKPKPTAVYNTVQQHSVHIVLTTTAFEFCAASSSVLRLLASPLPDRIGNTRRRQTTSGAVAQMNRPLPSAGIVVPV